MKKTAALIEKFIRLANGDTLPASSLRGKWFEQMQSDGILVALTHGSRKSLRVADASLFRNYVASQYDIRNLEQTHELLSKDNASRAEQVAITGDSKFHSRRTFTGFLVNCYEPINAKLNGKTLQLLPPDGAFMFISDYKNFSIEHDVVVVGVENAENFRYIRQQKYLFKDYKKVLFVSRYPQIQSKDLRQWLLSIPNIYIHFGDFDLAGINIFISEFYNYLGERASFFIPPDIEQRIANGSPNRYNDQYAKFHSLHSDIPNLQLLINIINKYHRGYEQEGYIR